MERKKRKLKGVFQGYELAYKENRKNAQLLYLHLTPTRSLNLEAKLIDKLGFKQTIRLDDFVFLIQRKGETLRSHLDRLLSQNLFAEAEKALINIFELYLSEYQNGVYDHDHGVMQNTGFINDTPFRLDVGKLHKDARIVHLNFYKKDLKHVMWKIAIWAGSSHPKYAKEMHLFLANHYLKITGEAVDFANIDPAEFKKEIRL